MPTVRQPLSFAICPTQEPTAPAAVETTIVSGLGPAYLKQAIVRGHSAEAEHTQRC
jgi:hypothetical protein